MTCRGAGHGGTQIFLATLSNPLPSPATVNFAPVGGFNGTAHVPETICLGNATGGANTCTVDGAAATGSESAQDITVSSFGSNSVGVYSAGFSGVFLINIWTQNYYGIVGYYNIVENITGFVCDTSTICITAIGDGRLLSPFQGTNWQIEDSSFGVHQVGVWLDGMSDTVISGNIFQEYGYGIWVYSPQGYSSGRLIMSDNSFLFSFSYGLQSAIRIANPCVGCTILGNQFYGIEQDILLEGTPPSGSVLTVSKNHTQSPQYSFFSASLVTSGTLLMEGNIIESPGQYCAFIGNLTARVDNNICTNPFMTTAPTGGGANDYENGGFFLTGNTAYNFEASNNSVTSSSATQCNTSPNKKCPAVGIYEQSNNIEGSTSGNRSDYTVAVTDFSNSGSGLRVSFNEIVSNYGSTGLSLYSPLTSPGGLGIPGGLDNAGLCSMPAVGGVRNIGHCTSVLGVGGTCTCVFP